MDENFLLDYVKQRGLKNITKSQFEVLIFYQLFSSGKLLDSNEKFGLSKINNAQMYKIADLLKLDYSKVRFLVKEARFFESNTHGKNSFASILACCILKNIKSICDSVETGKGLSVLELVIENPIEENIVKRTLDEKGLKHDTSFSKSIIKIESKALEVVLTEEEKKQIFELINNALIEIAKTNNIQNDFSKLEQPKTLKDIIKTVGDCSLKMLKEIPVDVITNFTTKMIISQI